MSALVEIAMNMRSDARKIGRSRQSLHRGLRLTLQWKGPERAWILSLTRDNAWPGSEEEKICRDAFKVPTDATREADIVQIGVVTWYVIRLRWVMLEQLPLGIQSPAKAVRYE